MPLASLTKDRAVWLQSTGFEAAFIEECETSNKELLGGKRKVNFVFRSPEVLVEERFGKCLRYVCDKINGCMFLICQFEQYDINTLIHIT